MNQDTFAELKDVTSKIFNITELNILDKTRSLSKTLQNYITLLVSELDELKDIKQQREYLYGQLYKFYKEDYNRELESKHEYENYIYSNDKYNTLSIEVNRQEIIVKYLEETIDNIKKLSFNIKNWLEIKKYLEGN